MRRRIIYSVDGVPYDPPTERELEAARKTGKQRHPRRGWPRTIPTTTTSAYLSGLEALNLREGDPTGSPGDWHREATWWTPTYMSCEDTPYTARLWGPDGDVLGARVREPLRDARPALAALEHPDGDEPAPVWCATLAHAVIDVAWVALLDEADPPNKREVERWLNEAGLREARRNAAAVDTSPGIAAMAADWRWWWRTTLRTPDPTKSPARD